MALIKCTECGRLISNMATACPTCGCPVGKMTFYTRFYFEIDKEIPYYCYPITLRIGQLKFSIDLEQSKKRVIFVGEISSQDVALNDNGTVNLSISYLLSDNGLLDIGCQEFDDFSIGKDCLFTCKKKVLFNNDCDNPVLKEGIEIEAQRFDRNLYEQNFVIENGVLTKYAGNYKTVLIPFGVNEIGKSAFFENRETIQNILIPDSVTSICKEAFRNCKNLTSITIPDGVTNIGDDTFCHCTSLTSITIPDSVSYIGGRAFHLCTSLTSITIPDSVTSIGEGAFACCKSLVNLNLENNNPCYSLQDGVLFNKEKTKIVCFPAGKRASTYTIPDSVTSIGDSAFRDCDNLISITIPDSVTSIGNHAFSHCTSLTSINIPNSITSIGNGAFSGCKSLTSITIPDSVTSIDENAFSYCDNLTSIVIPDSVISIGGYAFCGCKSLTSITIPNSVKKLGKSAFEDCNKLTTVTIGSGLSDIDSIAFLRCNGLENITVDNNNQYYTSENGVLFNKEKTKIIEYPLHNRTKTFNLPNTLTEIYNPFSIFLESVTIPDSVTWMDRRAFSDSCSLKTVYFKSTSKKEVFQSIFIDNFPRIQLIDLEQRHKEIERRKREQRIAEQKRREKERQIAEQKRIEQLKADRRAKGLCQYCGSELKGLFSKKCTRCGEKKDY